MYNYNSKVYPTPRLDPVRLHFALEARGETPEDQPVSQADAQAELEERNWCSTSSRTGVFSWDVSGQTLSMFPNLQSYLSAGAKASSLNPIDAVHVFLVSFCTVCFQPHPSPWAVSNKWVSSAAGETAEEGREVWEEAATKEGNTGGLGRRGGTRLERSNGRGGFDAAMEKHDVYELNIFKWAIFRTPWPAWIWLMVFNICFHGHLGRFGSKYDSWEGGAQLMIFLSMDGPQKRPRSDISDTVTPSREGSRDLESR